MNYSQDSSNFFREQRVREGASLDTVRCTQDSPVHRRLVQVWLDTANLLQFNLI
jgi:hypothetical protein